MNPSELVFGLIVVVVLIGLAGFFAWRQVAALKRLGRQTDLPPDDRLYFTQQAKRRLFGSALMLVLAALLVGSYFLDAKYREMFQQGEHKVLKTPQEVAEGKDFLHQFVAYWVIALVVLFLFGLVAILDLRATLRYGYQRHRELRDEHRAELEAEVRRIRQQRNGHH